MYIYMEPVGLVSRNVCLEAFRKAFRRAQSVSINGGGAALSERLCERLRGRQCERLCEKTLRKALRKAVRKASNSVCVGDVLVIV